MFWCCFSLSCCWGYMETSTWDSFPLRLFPEQASPENQRGAAWTGWEHFWNLKLTCFCAPDGHLPAHSGVFYTSWRSGKLSEGSGSLSGSEHKGLREWPQSGANLGVKKEFCALAPINQCPWKALLGLCNPVWSSLTHSDLRGLDVLTQTFPQPFYIPVQGQVSIPDPINGADRSGFLSEWGKLNSIKLL